MANANCFQASCCLPKATNAHGFSVDNADWMGRLGSINQNIKFRDLILIGAHDSASFSIDSNLPMSSIAKCQNFDTTQQLQAGVRILDVRMATSKSVKSNVAIWHGCVQGGDLMEAVLYPVKDFVDRHPQEIIVLQLVPEHSRDFPLEEKKRALKLVKETLGARIVHGDHMTDLLRTWTLRDLQTKPGARVVVLVHDRFFVKKVDHRFTENVVLEEYGFAPMEKWLRSLWFNTRDKDALLDYALDDVQRYGRQKRQFHASQLVLTPGVGGFADVLAALIGINKLRPASLAFRLYGHLGQYLRENSSQGWNWVLLDFVDLGPGVIHFLTALNFPIQFKLHLALYHNEKSGKAKPGINVTPQLQSCVCRNRVLYIESFQKILGLPPDARGILTLVYTLGKETQVAVVNMNSSEFGSAVLLSGFGHSCEPDAITTIPPDRRHGYIHNGAVLLENSDVTKLSGTIVEFSNVDGVFSCQVFSSRYKMRSLDPQAIPTQIVMSAEPAHKLKVLVLISQQSFDRSVVQNQKNAITILDARRVDYAIVDGSDPANKEARNELFSLSNLRGSYPQFFLVSENGSKSFWGDMDTLNIANEEGRLTAELGGDSRAATPLESTMFQDRSVNVGPTAKSAPRSREDTAAILLLISQQSIDRSVMHNQQIVMTILDSQGINYKTLDGADPANKATRNELFALSERRGRYPQVFIVKDGKKHYWGDHEAVHDANEMGVLAKALNGESFEGSSIPAVPSTLNGRSTNIPAAPPVKDTPKAVVLISKQSFNRNVVQDQERALHTLKSMGIPFNTIDGADPQNKMVRDQLFQLSGLRAIYPQFFVVRRNGTKTFWGGMEVFEASNESGTLEQDMLELSRS
eukprot:scaffold710_cov171-Amphora_coffeaeformis.AAC.8